MRRMAYSSIAHGADGLFFFRWRTCRFGQEEYWCGILDHDNVPRRRYAEAVQLGGELRRIGPQILGTSVHIEAAVASSDSDVSNGDEAYSLGLPGPTKMAEAAHEWLFQRGYAVGCVHPADDLSGLKLLIIPHWPLFDAAWVNKLEEFVSRGGTLVIGARTATRDWNNNVVGETLPGVLHLLAGVKVEEYGRRNAPAKRPLLLTIADASISCDAWYEVLLPDADVEVIALWEGRHLTGKAAVTLRRVGNGQVIYVGSYLTAELVAALMPVLVARIGLQPLLPSLPAGIEIVRRENADRRLWFFINHADTELHIDNVPQGINLIGGAAAKSLRLQANEVAIICQKLPDET
jgi:beta-galactosidase